MPHVDAIQVHQSRQLTGSDSRRMTERHVLLGQHAQAVQMLLETDAKDESFYVDSLRACVITAISTPATSQSTIKLVVRATRIILCWFVSECNMQWAAEEGKLICTPMRRRWPCERL